MELGWLMKRYRYEFIEAEVQAINNALHSAWVRLGHNPQQIAINRKLYRVTSEIMRPCFEIEQPDTSGFNLARLMEVQQSA